ncbi:hypothetical protein, partial [Streptomyces yangpuensis]|uniref:hypothetical protein n=1 Tax=Streptomyces yangpuensis TaxID=1648182 RepID=UPI00369D0098
MRRAVRVRAALEGGLEGVEVGLVGDVLAGAEAGVGAGEVGDGVEDVEEGERELVETGLDPGVEAGALAGRGLRRFGHGAGEVAYEALLVGGEPEQLAGGEGGGQLHVADGRAGTAELALQGVEVPVPGGDRPGVLGRERCASGEVGHPQPRLRRRVRRPRFAGPQVLRRGVRPTLRVAHGGRRAHARTRLRRRVRRPRFAGPQVLRRGVRPTLRVAHGG